MSCQICLFFFFNDTATTEIYTLSLHDALPIFSYETLIIDDANDPAGRLRSKDILALADISLIHQQDMEGNLIALVEQENKEDRKSTRLNSSHANISYAVFCLKKKKTTQSHRL